MSHPRGGATIHVIQTKISVGVQTPDIITAIHFGISPLAIVPLWLGKIVALPSTDGLQRGGLQHCFVHHTAVRAVIKFVAL